MKKFQKDKSPRIDGWTIEFFIALFDFIGFDLLPMVEEYKREEKIHPAFNSTSITLIPKLEHSLTFFTYVPSPYTTLLQDYS